MRYVFDSGPLINLFSHYYPDLFPTLWDNFYKLIDNGEINSVREVYNEISEYTDELSAWAKENKKQIFTQPTIEELQFVREIFQIEHFQAMVRKRERLQGRAVADPFVIARAKVNDCQVVTTEIFKENAAKIPNVCRHFKIPCINLQGFMKQQKWTF